ncbi:MAG: hypothetical protein COV74_00360 [Candidatus Omnitrophica bacterium CG11_big_fil_rev_8_21_14_0_20_45_26]|uniref:Predicted DNA-binding protein ribbon-helix-helix domain-containing protein n=1 Tax=Candidatus Abzuiibacterium crystallinum TaxID=1974748 RepID=A0A2H0LT10_9BACT|nr:MAG: hypothetical protein COV74_00360 [Candidatus Omnitrophica bacterium CG11_big_fil_rev_8_21_14_0_20_45_26]PIW64609.1 MAG: hypothetical protein COW12_05420 [Candidatus Omnitrophica bacterium CG12_big_fil_rev_8_21_14_0_65_45_16]
MPIKKCRKNSKLGNKGHVSLYAGLTGRQLAKLNDLAKKHGSNESAAMREIIAKYLNGIDKVDIAYKPFKKTSPIGLKTISRTIPCQLDNELRLLSRKTGRRISELVRRAVDEFKNGR